MRHHLKISKQKFQQRIRKKTLPKESSATILITAKEVLSQ